MIKTSNMFYKTLVVGVIVLFIGVGIQPAFAVDVTNSISNDEDDCDICPKVSSLHLVILKRLLNRLEKYDIQLTALSKLKPELEEKFQEFLDNIATLTEINEKYMSILKWVIEINIDLDWLLQLGACIGWKFFSIPLKIIASFIKDSYFGEEFYEFIYGLDEVYGTKCWKFIPFLLRSIINIKIYEI